MPYCDTTAIFFSFTAPQDRLVMLSRHIEVRVFLCCFELLSHFSFSWLAATQ